MSNEVYDERFQRVWDRFEAVDKLAQQRAEAQDAATQKSEISLAAYKASANEFREALADQATHLLPRQEHATQHAAVVDKLNSLEARVLQNTAAQTGRSSGISSIGVIVVSIVGVLVGVATVASTLVTLLHTPNPAIETQAKLDQLIEQWHASHPRNDRDAPRRP